MPRNFRGRQPERQPCPSRRRALEATDAKVVVDAIVEVGWALRANGLQRAVGGVTRSRPDDSPLGSAAGACSLSCFEAVDPAQAERGHDDDGAREGNRRRDALPADEPRGRLHDLADCWPNHLTHCGATLTLRARNGNAKFIHFVHRYPHRSVDSQTKARRWSAHPGVAHPAPSGRPCGGRSALGHFPPAMRAADLETVFRIALPPLRLALRERYLKVRRRDPIALRVAVEEFATVERIRVRLARQGWWN